jgi:undecaprenyl-diphosphatase
MSIWLAIFLGLLQGIAEFLPISSSGHLMVAQRLFKLPENMLMFNILLHIATLMAVIIVFRRRLLELVKKPFCKTNICLVIATGITCAFVVLFKDVIDKAFTFNVLPFTFFITAILLFATSFFGRGVREVSYKTGIVTGLAQAVAVIPGFSRSGFTIAAGLSTGVKREAAAEFSFLMSIPIIIASFVYELISSSGALSMDILPMSVAFVAALFSGVVSITFMLSAIKNVKLHWFGVYLVVLSVLLLLL